MNLELNLLTKIFTLFSILTLMFASPAIADPMIAGEVLPPASAKMIEDPELIRLLAVGREDEPVWCYSNDANAIIISAPTRVEEACRLKSSQELESLKIRHSFEIDTLKIEIRSLRQSSEQTILAKDREIEKLTAAALKRPNDYTVWWATGGFVAGLVTAVSVFFLVK